MATSWGYQNWGDNSWGGQQAELTGDAASGAVGTVAVAERQIGRAHV